MALLLLIIIYMLNIYYDQLSEFILRVLNQRVH